MRHDNFRKAIHWSLSEHTAFAPAVLSNGICLNQSTVSECENLLGYKHSDRTRNWTQWPDITAVDKDNKTAHSSARRLCSRRKEQEKEDQISDLAMELRRLWKL